MEKITAKYPQILSTVVSSVSQENKNRLESDQLPLFNIENLPPGSQFKAIVLAKVSKERTLGNRDQTVDTRPRHNQTLAWCRNGMEIPLILLLLTPYFYQIDNFVTLLRVQEQNSPGNV